MQPIQARCWPRFRVRNPEIVKETFLNPVNPWTFCVGVWVGVWTFGGGGRSWEWEERVQGPELEVGQPEHLCPATGLTLMKETRLHTDKV